MPERINVIRLSEDERETLRGVAAPAEVKTAVKTISDSLRVAGGSARTAAQSVEMDPVKFRVLRDDLNARLQTLSVLPAPDEAKAPLVEKTEDALRVVNEALQMLDGAN